MLFTDRSHKYRQGRLKAIPINGYQIDLMLGTTGTAERLLHF